MKIVKDIVDGREIKVFIYKNKPAIVEITSSHCLACDKLNPDSEVFIWIKDGKLWFSCESLCKDIYGDTFLCTQRKFMPKPEAIVVIGE